MQEKINKNELAVAYTANVCALVPGLPAYRSWTGAGEAREGMAGTAVKSLSTSPPAVPRVRETNRVKG